MGNTNNSQVKSFLTSYDLHLRSNPLNKEDDVGVAGVATSLDYSVIFGVCNITEHIVAFNQEKKILVVDTRDFSLVTSITCPEVPTTLCAMGDILAVGYVWGKEIHLLNWKTAKVLHKAKYYTSLGKVIENIDDKYFIVGAERALMIWQITYENDKLEVDVLKTIKFDHVITALGLAPKRTVLVADYSTITYVSLDTGTVTKVADVSAGINSICYIGGTKCVISTGSCQSGMMVYDYQTKQKIYCNPDYNRNPSDGIVVIAEDVFACAFGNLVRFFDLTTLHDKENQSSRMIHTWSGSDNIRRMTLTKSGLLVFPTGYGKVLKTSPSIRAWHNKLFESTSFTDVDIYTVHCINTSL
jgi:hypothetical protein